MKFTLNRPIDTVEPTVVVDGGLPAGSHRFQLVVVNRGGQSSQPVAVDIVILPRGPVIPDPIRLDPIIRPTIVGP